MDNSKYQLVDFGVILSSSKAFDFYMDATGQKPPKMPPGKNTLVTPFVVADEHGVERAAALIYQTGFRETPAEKANGNEASGLGVVVAMNVPLAEGREAVDLWLDKMLGK